MVNKNGSYLKIKLRECSSISDWKWSRFAGVAQEKFKVYVLKKTCENAKCLWLSCIAITKQEIP